MKQSNFSSIKSALISREKSVQKLITFFAYYARTTFRNVSSNSSQRSLRCVDRIMKENVLFN